MNLVKMASSAGMKVGDGVDRYYWGFVDLYEVSTDT